MNRIIAALVLYVFPLACCQSKDIAAVFEGSALPKSGCAMVSLWGRAQNAESENALVREPRGRHP